MPRGRVCGTRNGEAGHTAELRSSVTICRISTFGIRGLQDKFYSRRTLSPTYYRLQATNESGLQYTKLRSLQNEVLTFLSERRPDLSITPPPDSFLGTHVGVY